MAPPRDEAAELTSYVRATAHLHARIRGVHHTLARHRVRGIWDPSFATGAYRSVLEAAVKDYRKTFGKVEGAATFSTETVALVAAWYAAFFAASVEAGRYADLGSSAARILSGSDWGRDGD